MDLKTLIEHPEKMSRETLYELRSLVAVYPYYQTARLLMLKNMYLLHDSSFDEELRRAAVYMTDRRMLFRLVEAVHYRITTPSPILEENEDKVENGDRTISLIDNFLDSMPKEEKVTPKRAPTPADAAVDYVSYLLETEGADSKDEDEPQMRGQELIDNFIDGGKIELKENPEYVPTCDEAKKGDGKDGEEGYFTETLAKIYIKQGRYSKALEIIKCLNLNNSKKNAYFADQIRFLEKLIINNNK